MRFKAEDVRVDDQIHLLSMRRLTHRSLQTRQTVC